MGRAGGRGGGSFGGGSFGGGGFGGGGRIGGGSFGGGSFGGGSSRGGSSGGRTGGRPSGGYHRPGGIGFGYPRVGGLFGYPRVGGSTVIINNTQQNQGGGGSPSPSNNNSNKNTGSGGSRGCLMPLLVVIMVISAIMTIFAIMPDSNEGMERIPLAEGSVIETSYYTDELGWIDNRSEMEKGLKYFYEKTGVQPHVYITDDIGSGSDEEIMAFAEETYLEMFEDGAHMLLVFYEKDGYTRPYALSGALAESVVDEEARNIIIGRLSANYNNQSYDDNEYFSHSFMQAANMIMPDEGGTSSAVVPGVVFVVSLVVFLVMKKKEKDEKEKKELEEMLNAPLETFGDTEAEELAKKYEDE